MQAFVDLFVNELRNERYNESFTCAMTWAFQPACTLHKNHFQLTDEEIEKLLSDADLNGDGRIDYAEFRDVIQLLKKVFI